MTQTRQRRRLGDPGHNNGRRLPRHAQSGHKNRGLLSFDTTVGACPSRNMYPGSMDAKSQRLYDTVIGEEIINDTGRLTRAFRFGVPLPEGVNRTLCGVIWSLACVYFETRE